MEGWISLHRRFLEWEWFDNNNMLKLFIHLLLSANHSEGSHQGTKIKRGQLKTGLDSLSHKLKISKQSLRTCLTRLENTGEINTQVTNKYRIITICKYDSYQNHQQTNNKQANKQLTIKQQTTNKQLTANNNENKNNNVNNDIKEIYDCYPSKCPIKNRLTSKGSKDKDKIKTLLNSISKDKLILTINSYIAECKKSNTYLKNFSSFLNNLPDYNDQKPIEEKRYNYRVHFTAYSNKTEKQYLEDLEHYGEALKLE